MFVNMDNELVLGVYAANTNDIRAARLLSQVLNIPLLEKPAECFDSGQFLLQLHQQTLSLCFTGLRAPNPITVDFTSGASAYRRHYGGGKGQLIAKAVGIKGRFRPHVVDLTAGLGQDGFVLATLGCQVDLIERISFIFQLLNNGLHRARSVGDDGVKEIANRMQAYESEAITYLQNLTTRVDVIYLDPMFPKRDKLKRTSKDQANKAPVNKAQVNKAMMAFQSIVGSDLDAGTLLKHALAKAKYRVVVKRPRKAPSMNQQWPELQLPVAALVLAGKSSRYDVYTLAKMPLL